MLTSAGCSLPKTPAHRVRSSLHRANSARLHWEVRKRSHWLGELEVLRPPFPLHLLCPEVRMGVTQWSPPDAAIQLFSGGKTSRKGIRAVNTAAKRSEKQAWQCCLSLTDEAEQIRAQKWADRVRIQILSLQGCAMWGEVLAHTESSVFVPEKGQKKAFR